MNLTIAQLAALAAGAGFSGDDLVTAVAIALAESAGGNPTAYNPETAAKAPTGKGSFGLWQIYLNAHPEFAGQNLYDPQTNASAAFSVYEGAGGSFQPWSTFKSGAYLAYVDSVNSTLAPAATDVVASDGSTPSDTSGGSGSAIGLIVGAAVLVWAASKMFNG